MERFLSENKYLILAVVSVIAIGILGFIKSKKTGEENKIENFGVKKENGGGMSEKDIKGLVNEIFSKLTTPLQPDLKTDAPTDITQINGDDSSRVGVTKWFNISSGSRDKTKYPDPNRFVYTFPYRLWNVYSVELVRLSIPRGQYTVDTHNNKMDIVTNGSSLTVIELETGFYNINTYIVHLNNVFTSKGIQITASYNAVKYSVNLSNTSGASGDDYEILYNSGPNSEDSNFNELGFEREDLQLDKVTNVSSTRRVDLFGTCCVNIELNEINYDSGNNTLSSVLINNTAITVYENNCISSKRHLRPLKNLLDLTIEITFTAPFKDKRLYNLNGLDFDMTLEVICVEKKPVFLPSLQKFN